ncbi:uncharacterized protein [Palaemon carinicauda]|uniref:uncharacterized protein n=1 Tax=Palaemon carinicauda TaxID=392227 RepID=UPI0035B6553C
MYTCDTCDLEFYDWNELKYHLESHLLSSAERKLCGHFEQIFIPEIKREEIDITDVGDNIEETDIGGEKSDVNYAEPKIKDLSEEKLDNNCMETQEVDLISVKLPVNIDFAEPNVKDNNCTETQETDLISVKLPVNINLAELNVKDNNCMETQETDLISVKLPVNINLAEPNVNDNNCTEIQETDLISVKLPVNINFAEPNVSDNNCTETKEIDLPSVKLPVDINFALPNVTDNSEKKLHKKFEKSDTFTSKNDYGKSKKPLYHVSAKATSDNHKDDSVPTVDKERPFKCTQCVKYFKNIFSLRCHMRVHLYAKNYMCPICKRSFPYDCKLKKHMVVHSENKTYVCKICDKRFALYRFLVNHTRRCSSRKDNSNSFNHKAKLSIKGLCGQSSVLKRKKEISQDSHSSSLHNIKSIRNNGLDVDANHVLKKETSVMSLDKNCLKSDDSSRGKLQFEIGIDGGITSSKCLRVESDELDANKKLFGQRKGEAGKDILKQEHSGTEVPKKFLVKEVDTLKHEKLSNKTERQPLQLPREMCKKLDSCEGKADTCSAANRDEKGVPYLHFINELFIVDELVTDEIYENASDPLL